MLTHRLRTVKMRAHGALIQDGTTNLTSLLAVLRVTRASMASGALVTKGKLGEDV